MLLALSLISLSLALLPLAMVLRNLPLYQPPMSGLTQPLQLVSVLIPARNEEASIRAAVEAVLAGQGVPLEVIVLDDHSQDRTWQIVKQLAAADSRVRCYQSPPLPTGWCGKQHACHVLASLAQGETLVFIDADVRLTPAGLARAVGFLQASGAALVSGVPRQETFTLAEKLLIPLIHFLLLGFLPLGRMRRYPAPSLGAGCGQLFLTSRSDYERSGGHAAIRESLHDGLTLPRAYRRAGLMTDLFDATDVATCRMYRSGREVLHGLAKNAIEGLASPSTIVPATLMLILGQTLPPVLLAWAAISGSAGAATVLNAAATAAALATRLVLARRFRQSWLGACLHPLGILLLLGIQWVAFARWCIGHPVAWKSRTYGAAQPV